MKKFLPLLLLTASAAVHAQSMASLAAIEAVVKGFVATHIAADQDTEFTVGRLDPRLRLVQCETEQIGRAHV